MLYPREVTHREGDLAIDSPDDASEHGGPHGCHVSSLAPSTEGLVVKNDNVKEEDNEGGVETISHPPKYPWPVEKQVSWSLLIQCWKLRINVHKLMNDKL